MEETFNQLKKEGKNSVDNLIKWMKDSKIVDESKATEAKARKLFENVKDTANVELDKFKQALTKLAAEQRKTVEELSKTLASEGQRFLTAGLAAAEAAGGAAVGAATAAFKEAMTKK